MSLAASGSVPPAELRKLLFPDRQTNIMRMRMDGKAKSFHAGNYYSHTVLQIVLRRSKFHIAFM